MRKFLVIGALTLTSSALFAMHGAPTASFSSFYYLGTYFPGNATIVSPLEGGNRYTGYYFEGNTETVVASAGPLNPCKVTATQYFREDEIASKDFPDGLGVPSDPLVVDMLHVKIEVRRLIDKTRQQQVKD